MLGTCPANRPSNYGPNNDDSSGGWCAPRGFSPGSLGGVLSRAGAPGPATQADGGPRSQPGGPGVQRTTRRPSSLDGAVADRRSHPPADGAAGGARNGAPGAQKN